MTDEVQDETAGFETTTSDMPEVAEAPQPEAGSSQEASETKSDGEAAKEGEEEKEPGESATAEDGKNEGEESDSKPDKSNRVQKRIDKVVRQREEANRRAEAAEKRAKELEAKMDKGSDSEQQAKEPVESDFETYDEYLDALEKFDQADASENKAKPEAKKDDSSEDDSSGLTDEQRTAMAVIKEKLDQDAEKYPDFKEVALNPEVPVTPDMLEALAECDDPSKVLYHLGKNKDLATEIAGKSKAQQMREIAKLDIAADIKPPKPTKTTKAADPIEPVGGSSAQEKPVSDMSFSEYEDKMNKQERERGGRW